MARPRRIASIASALIVAALGTWVSLHFLEQGGDASRDAGSRRAATLEPTVPAESAVAPESVVATRDEFVPPPGPDVVLDPEDDVATDREAQLSGVVQDGKGTPIAGATVEVLMPPSRGISVLDLERAHRNDPFAELRTDRAGRFALRFERGLPVDLDVSAAGFASRWVTDRHAGERIVVVLDQGCSLTGRLTRARDGAPVAAARLRVFRLGGPSSVSFLTTSDANGRYRFDGLPADSMELEVLPERERSPDWTDLHFGPDGTLVKDFVLEPEVLVRGRVTDATSGRPIAAAEVGEGWVFAKVARCDADGAYELHGFGCAGSFEVYARAPGYGRQLRTHLTAAVDGVITLDFAMAPARSVTGRVVDAARAPVEGVYVAAVASVFLAEGQLAEWPSTTTGKDGRFEVRDLTADVHHALFVQQRGAATVVFDLPAAELAGPSFDVGDVVLAPPALLLGRVVDEKGDGVPDVETTLNGTNWDRYRLLAEGEAPPASAGFYLEQRRTRTDDRGRFSFGDLPAGSFEVGVAPRQRQAPAPVHVTLAAGELKQDVVVSLKGGAEIAGRVVDSKGDAIPDVYVTIDATEDGSVHLGSRTSADGRFEAKGIDPGNYRVSVQVFAHDRSDERSALLPEVVEKVAAGTVDLQIEMKRGVPIRGVVVDESGRPLAQSWVNAQIGTESSRWYDGTDAEGRFSVMVPDGATVNLRVHARLAGNGMRDAGVVATGVKAGAVDVVLMVAPPTEGAEPKKR